MSNRSLFGLLLVLIGAAFILNNYFNIFEGFSSWWPLLIILIGLIQILKRSTSILGGLLIMAIGFLFMGRNLELIPGELILPLALILVGCWFIFSRLFGKSKQENMDQISYFTLFSGLKTNNHSQNFKGGSVAAVFGGSDINLRGARISDQGALLELTAVFGGIDIVVPEHWQVQIAGTPVLGGWENKTTYNSKNTNDNEQVLKVNCIAVFGGVTIKN